MLRNIKSQEKIKKLIEDGVIFLDPDNVYIDDSCEVGTGTIIYPGVIITNNVTVKNNCVIYAYSCLNNKVTLNEGVKVGQYTLIRDDVMIGSNSSIGPHCEIVRSILGCFCMIGHKNFIGDTVLMDQVKFGASVIIANSNWNERFKTFIGQNTKIGVNVTLVAPINIGSDCFIAAGSVVRKNIEDHKFVKSEIQNIVKENKQ